MNSLNFKVLAKDKVTRCIYEI